MLFDGRGMARWRMKRTPCTAERVLKLALAGQGSPSSVPSKITPPASGSCDRTLNSGILRAARARSGLPHEARKISEPGVGSRPDTSARRCRLLAGEFGGDSIAVRQSRPTQRTKGKFGDLPAASAPSPAQRRRSSPIGSRAGCRRSCEVNLPQPRLFNWTDELHDVMVRTGNLSLAFPLAPLTLLLTALPTWWRLRALRGRLDRTISELKSVLPARYLLQEISLQARAPHLRSLALPRRHRTFR